MQIQQVRELLQDYPADKLRLIIGELYKILPKKVIEEKGVDVLLKDPDGFLENRRKNRKAVELPDFEEVKEETELFIENAKQQYYFAPNRVIPKKDRPKWRFIVKRLYKDLLTLTGDTNNLPQVSELLEKLYCLLCEACGVYLFSSDDPFASVGIKQSEFYRQVIAAKKQAFLPGEWVPAAIRLIVENHVDRNTLPTDLMYVLVEFLNTAPLKEQAAEQADRLRREFLKSSLKRRQMGYSEKSRNNDLVELVLILQMALGDYEKAISYFKAHYVGLDDEVSLYVLLRWLFHYGLKDLWLREYEAALDHGIQPRKALRNTYQYIRETGKFPEYMG
ncbi:MAG: hypothetical protein AB1523_07855 [Bacillota bacterium]